MEHVSNNQLTNDTLHDEPTGLDSDQLFDPVAYINRPRWQQSRLGLERIQDLLDRLGRPQDQLQFVHVAGTNGKGSTCAFTASILQAAGYRTGMFTSPYIIEFCDRIRVNGQTITMDQLRKVTLRVRDVAEAMEDHPTEFELMTAVAILFFAQQACDIVILEVGLGGRLDSTNVIDAPLVCAIAPIAFDHMAFLGHTLDAIAREKAGIIKTGARVVSADQKDKAAEVIRETCKTQQCMLTCVNRARLAGRPTCFDYGDYHQLHLSLLGTYQTENAALAIEIVQALRACGWKISDKALRSGLADAQWPGRFQIVAHDPTFILDGGHNPQGACVLIDSLVANFPDARPVFLMGVLADKDYDSMLATMIPYARAFVTIAPPNPRALSAHDLADAITRIAATLPDTSIEAIRVAQDIPDAMSQARTLAGLEGLVCACGSLYSEGDIFRAL